MSFHPEKEVQEFSKDQLAEKRSETAHHIREKRAEYFKNRKELDQRISELARSVESLQKHAVEAVAEIKGLEDRMEHLKSNLWTKITGYFERKEIREQLDIKLLSQQDLERELQEKKSMLEEAEDQAADRSLIDETKQKLDSFYKESEQAWQEYISEEKDRDVQNVMEQYGVTFFHGILNGRGPIDNNRVTKGHLGWKTKLKLVLSLKPTISTSTISERHSGTWGHHGLILRGGSVEDAFASDGITIASGVKKRVRQTGIEHDPKTGKPVAIQKRIEKAVQSERGLSGNYNELTVKEPEPAAYGIKLDANGEPDLDVSFNEIRSTCEELGLPLVAIKDGIPHRINMDKSGIVSSGPPLFKKKLVIDVGERFTPSDIAGFPNPITKERRQALVEELLEASTITPEIAKAA